MAFGMFTIPFGVEEGGGDITVDLVENTHVIVGASGSLAAAVPKDGDPF